MKRHDLFINLGLLLGTILLFFGGVEIVLRVTGLQTTKPNPPRIYQKNEVSDISYELKPSIRERAYRSTVTTNRLGFRGPELTPGNPVVAVLGDSIAFGYGVEDHETIPAKLQALLPDVNVVNTASPGYNLLQQTAVFREKVRPLDPALLILIFHFNDVEEVGLEIGQLDDDGILRPAGWTPAEEQCSPVTQGLLKYLPGKCWLDIHSAFYRAAKKFVNARQGKRDLENQETTAKQNAFSENITDEALAAYGAALARLAKMLPKNLPRLFVLWPERHLHFIARPKLKALAEKNGFIVLDLYEVFGNQAETLGWDTVHPSAKTNVAAAEIIQAAIEYYGLLQAPR